MLNAEEKPEEFPRASENIPASINTPPTASEDTSASADASATPQALASADMPTAEQISQPVAPTGDVPLARQPITSEAAMHLISTTLATTAADATDARLQQTFYAAVPRPLAPVVGSTPSTAQEEDPVGPQPNFPVKDTPIRFLQATPSVLEREIRLAQPAPSPVLSAAPTSVQQMPVSTPDALKGRAAIAQQVERSMLGHFAGMTDATLSQWRSQLDKTLADATGAHTDAKNAVKKVHILYHLSSQLCTSFRLDRSFPRHVFTLIICCVHQRPLGVHQMLAAQDRSRRYTCKQLYAMRRVMHGITGGPIASIGT